MSSKVNDFQFELNETLYFNHGDEVLELVGISLNPDITIHPNDTDVFMRGKIELRGEYIRDEERREDDIDIDEMETKRFVNQVESKEERIAVFTHHFPVDITVPTSRVENLDDVRIEIVNFDYELPMNTKLHFAATAEIQGIKAEIEPQEEEQTERTEAELETETETEAEFSPFEFEVERAENDFEDLEEEQQEQELEDVDEREELEIVELEEKEPRLNWRQKQKRKLNFRHLNLK